MPVDWVVVGLDNGGTANNGTILDSSGRVPPRLDGGGSQRGQGEGRTRPSMPWSSQWSRCSGSPAADHGGPGGGPGHAGPASGDGVISSKGATNSATSA